MRAVVAGLASLAGLKILTSVEMVRGIFSATQISRQLAMPVDTLGAARTFAELELALHS